jgi:hypothetical protein
MSFKIPKIETPTTLDAHNFCANFRPKQGFKQSCNPCQDLFNNIWHVTYTHVNQSDSRFLVIKSQIGNLTPNPSFGNNLCFKYPNGLCQPILNIKIPRKFSWYKKLFSIQ